MTIVVITDTSYKTFGVNRPISRAISCSRVRGTRSLSTRCNAASPRYLCNKLSSQRRVSVFIASFQENENLFRLKRLGSNSETEVGLRHVYSDSLISSTISIVHCTEGLAFVRMQLCWLDAPTTLWGPTNILFSDMFYILFIYLVRPRHQQTCG